jgi:galactokinase
MNSVTTRAHGRVNLIGEHTDYNGGWVLPTTIPQYTEVQLTRSPGQLVIVKSTGGRNSQYQLGEEIYRDSWTDYLQGATKFLRAEGKKLSGFAASIHSTIPEGTGLSSSAALLMSFLQGLNELFDLNIVDLELARLGQRIENDFVGAKVGIMDHIATSLAKEGEALFLDTLTLHFERIPLPLDKMDLMVINSGISHRLSTTDGGYNERRSQCEEAAKLLQVKQLRDIHPEDLGSLKLSPVLMKRVRHVVTENARVHEAVKAIKERDFSRLGRLFVASHSSMRDDYEVSIPEIDILVELALKEDGVYGARLTGGGFGGSIIAMTEKGLKKNIADKILSLYSEKTGKRGILIA